jgi:hypothetical protein
MARLQDTHLSHKAIVGFKLYNPCESFVKIVKHLISVVGTQTSLPYTPASELGLCPPVNLTYMSRMPFLSPQTLSGTLYTHSLVKLPCTSL